MSARPESVERTWATARADDLAAVRALIREQGATVATDEEIADVVQAVDELACNVFEHGYAGHVGPLEVGIDASPDALVVRIRDRAPAFDPRSVPEPDLDLPLSRRPLGGMGVHLARALTDAIDHRILPGGGNEVTVTKRLRPTDTRE